MPNKSSTAIVPVRKNLPAVTRKPAARGRAEISVPFTLYDGERHFTDREDVRQNLPDILGRALARTWIDNQFRDFFEQDPAGSLADHGIYLPDNMSIEFQRKQADRPRIVVYEQRPDSKFKVRVLYLQLVMMAGR